MIPQRQISIPTLVRIKPKAIERIGIYMRRSGFDRVAFLYSDDLTPSLLDKAREALSKEHIRTSHTCAVSSNDVEQARNLIPAFAAETRAVIGFGGGKALDIAKYAASLAKLPYLAVPTSLSNDGFCSPQASLTEQGARKAFPAATPFGIVVDTEVCLQAPKFLWFAGMGDLVSKITAVADWKLAFHRKGTPVDDLSALLSDATVFQFLARPTHDLEGVRLLATALMMNGVAMAICGSSRPASGSEHLISHALDRISPRPSLHGLQVGVATYLVSALQNNRQETIRDLLEKTGFWELIQKKPFDKKLWQQAIPLAPSIKQNYYTILSEPGKIEEALKILETDEMLKRCLI
ncbi:MAG: iron-containing alcohol dehydrogenase family protein [bacterium]